MDLPFLSPTRAAVLRRFVASGGLRELMLFLVIGGTGSVFYTALNVFFTEAGIRPSLSIAITLAILIPPVYYLQHRLTFRSGRNHLSAFPRYAGAQLFGNMIAMIVAELFPAPIRAYPITAFVLIAAIVAALNYGLLKFWAFRHSPATVA
jgi:putative flippase GtrA